MKLFIAILTGLFVFGLYGKEISLSFDDAPRGSSAKFSGLERTKKIISELKKAGVDRAAFYVNTNKLEKDDGLKRIRLYKNAGHMIGNHTHSHLNIREISTEEYIKDYEKAHKILKSHGLIDYFYRYPFLRRGKTLEEVNQIHSRIITDGYTDAFVTVDNYDFYMESQFQSALKRGDRINYNNLKKYYIETLFKGIEFYEDLALSALGKPVKHVMLLHENDLAALFIGDLVRLLRQKGWKIISPEESYTDSITKHFPASVLNHGSGRVNALAVEAGYNGKLTSGLESTKVLDNIFKTYDIVSTQKTIMDDQ